MLESTPRMLQNLKAMLRLAEIGHSRTSVINPVQWGLVIVLVAFVVSAASSRTPTWVVIFLASATGLMLILLIVAYIYFMLKDPKELRSERYSLAQTAIEKHLLGDNLTGLIEVFDGPSDSPKEKRLGESTAIDIEQKDE
jgi:hypothetical protein